MARKAFWDALGASQVQLGWLFGPLAASWEALRASWKRLLRLLGPLGSILAASGGALVCLCDSGTCSRCKMLHHISCSKEVLISRAVALNPTAAGLLAASCLPLGASWEPLGCISDLLGAS